MNVEKLVFIKEISVQTVERRPFPDYAPFITLSCDEGIQAVLKQTELSRGWMMSRLSLWDWPFMHLWPIRVCGDVVRTQVFTGRERRQDGGGIP
jgi:hypothetical protein